MFSSIARDVREHLEFEAFMKRERENRGAKLWVSLLCGDRETTYPGYHRIAVPRNRAHWQFDPETFIISNRRAITFPSCQKVRRLSSWWFIDGFAIRDKVDVLFIGKLNRKLEVNWCRMYGGVTPEFAPGSLTLVPS